MPDADLSAYVASLVDKKLAAALAPHLEALERLTRFLHTGSGKRRGRPPGRAGRGAARKGDASRFHEGQQVRYRQGRGEFEAKVIAVDLERQRLTVERVRDGKKVIRPAAKLYGV